MLDPTFLFQTPTPSPTPAELAAWYKPIQDLWPVFAGAVALIISAMGGLALWRYSEKAAIHKTNAENIDALTKLLATREKELDEAREEIDGLAAEKIELEENHRADLQEKAASYGVLESEYKTVAGIVLSDVMSFAAQYDKFMSDRAAADDAHKIEVLQYEAKIRILQRTVEQLQNGDNRA